MNEKANNLLLLMLNYNGSPYVTPHFLARGQTELGFYNSEYICWITIVQT